MNRRFTSIYLYGEGLVNKVKKYKVAWKHTQTFSFMNPKEETGLASCYITCANKTDRQGEKVEKIKHRWNNRILDIKKENETEKKIEIIFQINLSVAIQVSCFDDLIDFSVNWLPRFIMVHLNSSALINPSPSMSNTLNISRISASVSVSFIRVSIRWRNSLKSMMPLPSKEKCKSSSV